MYSEILHTIRSCLGRVPYCGLTTCFIVLKIGFMLYRPISNHSSKVKNKSVGFTFTILLFEIRRSFHIIPWIIYQLLNQLLLWSAKKKKDYLVFFYLGFLLYMPILILFFIYWFDSFDAGFEIIWNLGIRPIRVRVHFRLFQIDCNQYKSKQRNRIGVLCTYM